jgi:single-strand DNA-binding protein
MTGFNRVILVGIVGSAPETQYIKKNFSKSRFPLATESPAVLPDGRTVTETQWHEVTAYSALSEFVLQYVKKGDVVLVEGSLKSRIAVSESGYRYKTTEVAAEKLQIISRSRKNSETPLPETENDKIGSAIPGFDLDNIPAAEISGGNQMPF